MIMKDVTTVCAQLGLRVSSDPYGVRLLDYQLRVEARSGIGRPGEWRVVELPQGTARSEIASKPAQLSKALRQLTKKDRPFVAGLDQLSLPQRRALVLTAGGRVVVSRHGDPIVYGSHAGVSVKKPPFDALEKLGLIAYEPGAYEFSVIASVTLAGATAASLLQDAGWGSP